MQILFFIYFYFLSKDHQLTYFNMLMPQKYVKVVQNKNKIFNHQMKNLLVKCIETLYIYI